jgi:hypothetical protein
MNDPDHVETYRGREIILVEKTEKHDTSIYRVPEYRVLHCPKYLVCVGDIRVMEHRTLKDARHWVRIQGA